MSLPGDREREVTALLARVGPRLRRILRSFRLPAEDAEDLLQDTLLALIRNWERIECPEAWLVRTVWRACCRRFVRPRGIQLCFFDNDLLERMAPEQTPAQERAELVLDLQALAARMSPRHWLLLQLRYGLGLSPEEIAGQLGYHPGSVRKLSRRAILRLRKAAGRPLR